MPRKRLGKEISEVMRFRVPGEGARQWRRMARQRCRNPSSLHRQVVEEYLRHYQASGARAAWVPAQTQTATNVARKVSDG